MEKNYVNENVGKNVNEKVRSDLTLDGKVKMSAPWVVYAHQVEAMFKEDPDVKVEYYDDEDSEKFLSLKVCGEDKADALAQLLPSDLEFGGVTLSIRVIPANDVKPTQMDLFRRALSGNPIVSGFVSAETLWGAVNFVVFKPEIVQYYDDNMMDLNGIRTTVYQDLAKEVFEGNDEVFFCTEKIKD